MAGATVTPAPRRPSRGQSRNGQPRLFAGGGFCATGPTALQRLARWDGSGWQTYAPAVGNGALSCFGAFQDGDSPSLAVGGSFSTVDGQPVSRIARFTGCPSAVTTVPGCFGNPALLTNLVDVMAVGQPFAMAFSTPSSLLGFAQFYLGAKGTDLAGCGLNLPGLGELLLAPVPSPVLLFQQLYATGSSTLGFTVPDDQALAGQVFHFQGAAVLNLPGFPVHFSNALAAPVRP